MHTVTTTVANEANVEQATDLLHGKEAPVWADSRCRCAPARVLHVQWHIAAWPSDMAKMPDGAAKQRARRHDPSQGQVRAKVEHLFRVIKCQFSLTKVRLKGEAKNTAHVAMLFAPSNPWMARKKLMVMMGVVRVQGT